MNDILDGHRPGLIATWTNWVARFRNHRYNCDSDGLKKKQSSVIIRGMPIQDKIVGAFNLLEGVVVS